MDEIKDEKNTEKTEAKNAPDESDIFDELDEWDELEDPDDYEPKTPEEAKAEEMFEAFLDRIRWEKATQNLVTVTDKKRYREALDSIAKITDLVKERDPDAETKVWLDGIFNTSLLFMVRTTSFDTARIKAFTEAIRPASVISVDPVDEDRVELGFTYEGVARLHRIGEKKNN